MAHTDAARAIKRTWAELRQLGRDSCNAIPCHDAIYLKPGCIICVHERKIGLWKKDNLKRWPNDDIQKRYDAVDENE